MTPQQKLGWSWVALTLALALHVADEALTDFLSVYNPAVETLRQRLGWFPMPTFTFEVWLAGLVTMVVLLLLLSRFAFGGRGWMVWLAYPYAVIMILNGLGHFAGSFYLGRLMPGVLSSPVLLAAAFCLLIRAGKVREPAA